MFSSKDYEELAEIIRHGDIRKEPECPHAREEVTRQHWILVSQLAEFLRRKDPRLSVIKFLRDCGV